MFIPTYIILGLLILIVILFVWISRRTVDAVRWLNFKINVLEKLMHNKATAPTKDDIENAVDSVLANDVEYKVTIKMLNKFIKVINKTPHNQGSFRHIMEHRLERSTDLTMVASGLFDKDDIHHTIDVFQSVDLKAAVERFNKKFSK